MILCFNLINNRFEKKLLELNKDTADLLSHLVAIKVKFPHLKWDKKILRKMNDTESQGSF